MPLVDHSNTMAIILSKSVTAKGKTDSHPELHYTQKASMPPSYRKVIVYDTHPSFIWTQSYTAFALMKCLHTIYCLSVSRAGAAWQKGWCISIFSLWSVYYDVTSRLSSLDLIIGYLPGKPSYFNMKMYGHDRLTLGGSVSTGSCDN